MKRSVLFLSLLISLISALLITRCQGPSIPPTGTPVASFASYPSTALGVVIDPAGKVIYVEPGSAAELAGIVPGDVLQKINNLSVNSQREQVRAAILAASGNQILIVLLKSNGNVLVMNVKLLASAPHSGIATSTPLPSPDDYL